jgi:flagellar motility protein MotE (MotC chaperone)
MSVAGAALSAALLILSGASAAAQDSPPDAGSAENAIQYCANVADAAADARFMRQAAALADMDKQIQAHLEQLETKRKEYEDWLRRREEFLKKADEAIIAMFSQMRPDAAAAQMGVMSDDIATAILTKVNPRVSSAILNEMEPARAARLTGIMVGIAKRTQS